MACPSTGYGNPEPSNRRGQCPLPSSLPQDLLCTVLFLGAPGSSPAEKPRWSVAPPGECTSTPVERH
jgi:hypothetical protein